MESLDLMGGKLQLFRRPNSRFWQCRASVGGKQHQHSTKRDRLDQATQTAEDWFLTLHAKDRAGVLNTGPTFRKAADQFLKEYGVITEGQRSEKWVDGHEIRLRVHLVPYFGDLPLNKVTSGKVQEYRVHRMTTYKDPNPESKSKHKPKEKPPARSNRARGRRKRKTMPAE